MPNFRSHNVVDELHLSRSVFQAEVKTRFRIYSHAVRDDLATSECSAFLETNSRGHATFYSQGDETCRVRERRRPGECLSTADSEKT